MHLTSHITHSNGYSPYIAYYRSNGFDQRFRKLKLKPKLNPPNAHRSQIKICEKWHTHNVQFRFMPNTFQILKPIQKSSKRVWVFLNTGANAFAKNQMRLAYEDKRDLYCRWTLTTKHIYFAEMFAKARRIFLPSKHNLHDVSVNLALKHYVSTEYSRCFTLRFHNLLHFFAENVWWRHHKIHTRLMWDKHLPVLGHT